MSKNKQSLKQTIQLIVDILSFETSDAVLGQQLASNMVDWEAVVTVASKHLVLPAVYCRLHQKSLLSYLPEELNLYLEELTQLNRDRNRTLLAEAQQISKLLESNQINHVFIKGMALLAGNYFEDLGERMIGDIDILVASTDLDNAFELLVNEGYSKFVEFNYEVKNYRHRPRQISEKRLAAIELHDQLLKHGYHQLIDKDSFLSEKKNVNGIAIPCAEHLIWNTIYGQQINDHSYYYNILKLKGLFDVLVVKLQKNENLIYKLSKQKHSLRFLALSSLFCPTIAPVSKNFSTRFYQKLFLFALQFPLLGKWLFKLRSTYLEIMERVQLFFYNKSYRDHVVKNRLFK
ncbi:MAG: nucleotidyltransferase family protein [Gelidibacter sp.]